MTKIILFDGDCNFCNESVLFIIKRDKHDHFKFCSLQSKKAATLLQKHNICTSEKSLILIDNNKAYTKSTAALHISHHLTFPWHILYYFIFIPKLIRDFAYTTIANNRYKLMGRKTKCMIPTAEMKNKFLH